jgi:hypothetical protein
MTSFDPYAPPRAPAPGTPAVPRAWVKWAYAAAAGVRFSCAVLYYAQANASDDLLRVTNAAVRGLAVVCAILGLVWIHGVFRDLNRQMFARGAPPGLTPAGAVGRFFIPLYNVYWLFAVHLRIGDALRALGQARAAQPAVLAGIVGSLGQLVAILLSRLDEGLLAFRLALLLPALWVLYMVMVDRVRAAARAGIVLA